MRSEGGSRARAGAAAGCLCLISAAALAGCQREARDVRGWPPPRLPPAAVQVSELRPDGAPAPTTDPSLKKFEANAYDITQGGQLYRWYNCSGCHFQGGGGIGPALMDSSWRYGGQIEQIYASISDGRPNGMPTWRAKIPPQQIWQIAAYVRSLSGVTPHSALSARYDELTGTPAATQTTAQKPTWGFPASTQGGS